MKRLTAVVTAAATSAALAAAAIGTEMPSASAAARPSAAAARSAGAAGHEVQRQIARTMPGEQIGKPVPGGPVQIVSQYGPGQYVSVVNCQGQQVPPPVHLQAPNTPLQLQGVKPSYAVALAMAMPGRYKTVYSCTLVVKRETQTPVARVAKVGKGGGLKHVTLNTGFGGESRSVFRHHPWH